MQLLELLLCEGTNLWRYVWFITFCLLSNKYHLAMYLVRQETLISLLLIFAEFYVHIMKVAALQGSVFTEILFTLPLKSYCHFQLLGKLCNVNQGHWVLLQILFQITQKNIFHCLVNVEL